MRPDCGPQFALLRPTRIQLARDNLKLGDRFSERLRNGVGDPQILIGLAAPLATAHSKFTAAFGRHSRTLAHASDGPSHDR